MTREEAVHIVKTTQDWSELRLALQELVPELRESEDERIRKEIVKTVELYGPKTGNPKLYNDMIAWLEKQGERSLEEIAKEVTKNKETAIAFLEFAGIVNDKGELADEYKIKDDEQQSAIKLERDENGEPVLTPFEAELFSMMSEAWQGYSFGEEVNIAKIVKEHSKELLERANEQKPAEWSEEPASEDLEKEVKKLWDEINTGHSYSILDSYNQFYGICLDIANWKKEQLVNYRAAKDCAACK